MKSIARVLITGSILSIAVLVLGVSEAEATWWLLRNHGSHGSHGSRGSHGSYGSYGSHGSFGSHGGYARRHHRYRGSHGSHGGSYGGSYGSYGGSIGSYGGSYGSHGGSIGSYGGSIGSYGGSIGSYGSYGGSHGYVDNSCGSSGGGGGVYSYPSPAIEYSTPSKMLPGDPAPIEGGTLELPPATDSAFNRGAATLTVSVPAEARVFVNGILTSSVGAQRQYISRGLTNGHRYTYEVRAQLERNGETVEETRSVQLRAGEKSELAFSLNDGRGVDTSLTLNVPSDAKVMLSGRETAGTGEVRVFTTSKLTTGKKWSDYTVLVSVNRDGRTLTQQKSITLNAGDTREVTFLFDAPQVAAR